MSKRYFTGKPCPQGHIAERYRSSGTCVLCAAAKKKAWHKANVKYVLAKNAEWREQNRERFLAVHREVTKRYNERNKGKVAAARAAWKAKNPGYHNAASAKWRAENPEQSLAIVHRRRAAKLSNGGTYTKDDIRRLERYQSYRCYWCCRCVFSLTIDHVIPLVRGGSNNADNIRLACSRCNYRKNKTMPLDFVLRLLEVK